jgi:hypothetical protein
MESEGSRKLSNTLFFSQCSCIRKHCRVIHVVGIVQFHASCLDSPVMSPNSLIRRNLLASQRLGRVEGGGRVDGSNCQ